MKTAKKIKEADYHKENLRQFIEIYNKKQVNSIYYDINTIKLEIQKAIIIFIKSLNIIIKI